MMCRFRKMSEDVRRDLGRASAQAASPLDPAPGRAYRAWLLGIQPSGHVIVWFLLGAHRG
jgi:hypothetical protein